jgi:uncharacterized protein YggE
LHKAGVKDFGSSRVTLSQEFRYSNGESKFVGYQAKIEFNVVLREMDKVDAVLSELIAAGANTPTSVTFQTTRLKELRADARRRAVAAAREKAELYSGAAGAAIGPVLAIEDLNPEMLTGRSANGEIRRRRSIQGLLYSPKTNEIVTRNSDFPAAAVRIAASRELL